MQMKANSSPQRRTHTHGPDYLINIDNDCLLTTLSPFHLRRGHSPLSLLVACRSNRGQKLLRWRIIKSTKREIRRPSREMLALFAVTDPLEHFGPQTGVCLCILGTLWRDTKVLEFILETRPLNRSFLYFRRLFISKRHRIGQFTNWRTDSTINQSINRQIL